MDKKLRWIGIGVSAAYLGALLAWVLWGSSNTGGTRWAEFTSMQLNNIGDFLAGAFSPLAFLWLVLGFFQQGQELQQSREALLLQAQELRHSVDQQRQMVEVARDEHSANLRALDLQQAAIEAERAAAAEAAKPKLYFTSGGSSTSGLRVEWRAFLHNAGASCMDVRLEFTTTSELKYIGSRHIPHLPHGERADLAFMMAAADAANGVLAITFLDIRGAPGQLVCDVIVVNHQLTIVPR